MKNFLLLLLLGLPWMCSAQYEYSIGTSVETLAERLQGEGVTILNPEVKCWDSAYGVYEGLGDLDIDNGIVLSNSRVNSIFNTYTNIGTERPIANFVTTIALPYDSSVEVNYFRPLLASWNAPDMMTTYITCAVEMDVVSNGGQLQLPYVFGDILLDSFNDNYYFLQHRNWVVSIGEDCRCFPHNNIIGIFLSGPDHEDTTNYAVFEQSEADGDPIPVNRYTLRVTPELFDQYCSPFARNPAYDTMLWGGSPRLDYLRFNTDGYRDPNINFPAYTPRMVAKMPVNPCDTYRLVIAVGHVLGLRLGGEYCVAAQGTGSAMFVGKMSSGGGEDTCMSMGVGLVEEGWNGVKIYPNPFGGELVFGSTYADREYQVQVCDILGRVLHHTYGDAGRITSELNNTIVPDLNSGQLYFFVVRDVHSRETGTFKLRKE